MFYVVSNFIRIGHFSREYLVDKITDIIIRTVHHDVTSLTKQREISLQKPLDVYILPDEILLNPERSGNSLVS